MNVVSLWWVYLVGYLTLSGSYNKVTHWVSNRNLFLTFLETSPCVFNGRGYSALCSFFHKNSNIIWEGPQFLSISWRLHPLIPSPLGVFNIWILRGHKHSDYSIISCQLFHTSSIKRFVNMFWSCIDKLNPEEITVLVLNYIANKK